MKTLMAIAVLAAAPLAASADVSKEDIKKLAAAGVGDEVILSYIRTHGPVQSLSADDLVELKKAGASEKVLSAAAGGSATRTPMPQVERQAPAPSTEYPSYTPSYTPSTVVYDSSYAPYYPYYSTYYWGGYPYYYSYWPRYSWCGPRVGVGFSTGWHCAPRATWSLSFRR
jgi:hypothetical protein